MKKIFTLIWILAVTTLFAGCSLMPTASQVKTQVQPPQAVDLFNFEGLNYNEGEVLVKTLTPESLLKATKEGSTLIKEWSEIGWALISVPAGETTLSYIEKLQKEPGIILAQPNILYTIDPVQSKPVVDPEMIGNDPAAIPAAPVYDLQWGFQNINAEAAWDITTGSSQVVVAIVDTGVDVLHPEFDGKTFIDAFDATTYLTGLENMKDMNGHGTHVAGIAADDGNSGFIAGVAWDCPIMPIRVENDNGSIYTSYLIEAMYYLGTWAEFNANMRVVANMSIGGRGYNFAFKDAIDFAFERGVLLITSAGNDSKRIISYPSAYNGVVSVAASTPYDVKAEFSTEGWWNSVAAPGVEILSTVPESYAFMQGTSMASPFVTGAAALLLSHNPNLTPLEIKNQIEMTARGYGFSEELGYGILDLEALLGPVQPMQYGGLNVTTNIISNFFWVGVGVVTVFDDMGNLVGFGTTGEYGNYLFHALKPGTYTVNVSYFNQYAGNHSIQTGTVNVGVGQTAAIDFVFAVPQSLEQNLVYSEDISVQIAPYQYQIPITITQTHFYEFMTSFYTNESDTELYIFNADGLMLAYNDDHLDRYSYIGLTLEAGDYTVIVQDYDADHPFDCTFSIYQTTVTY